MGVPEDINWLKSNEDGWGRIFRLIAGGRGLSFRELKKRCDISEWWPLKSYIRLLLERGLVEISDGLLVLSDHGKKVFDTMRTTEELASL